MRVAVDVPLGDGTTREVLIKELQRGLDTLEELAAERGRVVEYGSLQIETTRSEWDTTTFARSVTVIAEHSFMRIDARLIQPCS